MKRPSKTEKFDAYNEEHSRIAIPNMHYKDHAPVFVSVIGPPFSGKSAFVREFVSHYVGEKITPAGPVTLKSRSRRFSVYESTSRIENVIDTIKVSDIVVLTVNLDVGLEKETLEAITMINSHGLTKLMVLYTHSSPKVQSTVKSAVAKRISQEFSFAVKFYDLQSDRMDKIARSIELMKCRPLEWKCTHPHIVVDKASDGYVFGYVRGGPFRRGLDVHVPGQGDFAVDEIVVESDPCDPLRKNCFLYNPTAPAAAAEMESCCSDDGIRFDEDAVQLFGQGDHRKGSDYLVHQNTDACEGTDEAVCEDDRALAVDSGPADDDRPRDFEALKNQVSRRFRREPQTEEDYVDKFNEEYAEEEKSGLNFLQEQKRREMEIKKELDECADLVIPGQYCRIRLDLAYEPGSILILGSYLIAESRATFLQGKVIKNRWQKGDLKSNAPQFVSMGWCRFQTIPLFALENRVIKYLRGSTGAAYSEVAFYGPSVPVGTSFFVFNLSGRFRIMATGQVLDSSGSVAIKKKLKLIGYPKKVMGNTAFVQSMFSSDREVSKFINAKLRCASGLRGVLKNSIGKGGDFRATFEGTMLSSEVIFIKCFVSILPYAYLRHTAPDARYIRSLREIKEAEGLPLYEDSISEDDSVDTPPDSSACWVQKDADLRMTALEKRLPFGLRKTIETCETVDLPTPPRDLRLRQEMERISRERQARDGADALRQGEEEAERSRKAAARENERNERKRKNAVENKQLSEKGTRRNKKAHKKSKRKDTRSK